MEARREFLKKAAYATVGSSLFGALTPGCAARAGKHVLCEKPMEVSVEKCEAMIAACAEHDRRLAIAYRCQFEPHHLECVRLAREGVLGEMRMIEASARVRPAACAVRKGCRMCAS